MFIMRTFSSAVTLVLAVRGFLKRNSGKVQVFCFFPEDEEKTCKCIGVLHFKGKKFTLTKELDNGPYFHRSISFGAENILKATPQSFMFKDEGKGRIVQINKITPTSAGG